MTHLERWAMSVRADEGGLLKNPAVLLSALAKAILEDAGAVTEDRDFLYNSNNVNTTADQPIKSHRCFCAICRDYKGDFFASGEEFLAAWERSK